MRTNHQIQTMKTKTMTITHLTRSSPLNSRTSCLFLIAVSIVKRRAAKSSLTTTRATSSTSRTKKSETDFTLSWTHRSQQRAFHRKTSLRQETTSSTSSSHFARSATASTRPSQARISFQTSGWTFFGRTTN